QTILGVGWSLFQPLSIMLMFVVFVGRMAHLAETTPYSYTLFVLAGALPWTFFSTCALNGGHSLLLNERLVTKVYFPRLALPLSAAYGLILGCRAALFGEALDWAALALSSAVGLLTLAAGLVYFRRVERTFADTI